MGGTWFPPFFRPREVLVPSRRRLRVTLARVEVPALPAREAIPLALTSQNGTRSTDDSTPEEGGE